MYACNNKTDKVFISIRDESNKCELSLKVKCVFNLSDYSLHFNKMRLRMILICMHNLVVCCVRIQVEMILKKVGYGNDPGKGGGEGGEGA